MTRAILLAMILVMGCDMMNQPDEPDRNEPTEACDPSWADLIDPPPVMCSPACLVRPDDRSECPFENVRSEIGYCLAGVTIVGGVRGCCSIEHPGDPVLSEWLIRFRECLPDPL